MAEKNTSRPIKVNWWFDVEPYARQQSETLTDLQENLRLKKHLKRAVEREVAPITLIESIRSGIRA